MSQKRVAFFIRSLHKGGAEKQSVLLTNYLSKYYNTYLIVLHPYGDYWYLAKKFNINLITLNGCFFVKLIKLYRIFKTKKICVLFNFLPVNNVLGTVIAKLAGVKYIFGGIRGSKIHDSGIKMFLQKQILNRFSIRIISNSHEAKNNYSEYGFDKSKIVVLHNFINVPVKPFTKHRGNTTKILSVGRFIPEKDYLTSLRAIRTLIDVLHLSPEKLIYYIIGYGQLEGQINEEIRAKYLKDYVQIIDGRKNVEQYFKDAHIFLATSIYEGMPNVIMEAMSYSLPVVATNSGDTRFLVDEAKTGFLCNIGDYKQISECLKILIKNENLYKQFSINAYNFIKSNYSAEKQIINYKNLIENTFTSI